jgi:hypothetical protein
VSTQSKEFEGKSEKNELRKISSLLRQEKAVPVGLEVTKKVLYD